MSAEQAHPLIQRVTSDPLLLSDASVALFQSSLQHIVAHKNYDEAMAHASANDNGDFWPDDQSPSWLHSLRPYNVVGGVLQIPIMGVLLNRFPYQWGRWATGYDYIEKAFLRGMGDDNVTAIALVIDSPGGEVAGNFELVDKIYEGRGLKPIRAFAADHAYSAAYSLASAADDIIVTRSGGVGSIGVVMAHVEYAEHMEKMGIKVTYIFAGKHKVDGNPYEKLSEQAKTRFEERISKLYAVFTSTVARNRGMDEEEIRGTEALTYDAEDGIKIGLADRLGSLEDEMSIFAKEVANTGDETMADTKTKDDKTHTQAQYDDGVAAATAAGTDAGKVEGAAAERTRISAIINSDEGTARPQAALHTALNSDMSADAATSFLAGLAEEVTAPAAAESEAGTKPAAKTPFEQAMGNGDQPTVDAAGDKTNTQMSDADTILADYNAQSGTSAKAK